MRSTFVGLVGAFGMGATVGGAAVSAFGPWGGLVGGAVALVGFCLGSGAEAEVKARSEATARSLALEKRRRILTSIPGTLFDVRRQS